MGSVLRYGLHAWLQGPPGHRSFPLGTVVVNISGCLVMGVVMALADARGMSENVRVFLMVGLLGGFTTFSAFSSDTLVAWREGRPGVALLNVAISVVACLAAVWAGYTLAKP